MKCKVLHAEISMPFPEALSMIPGLWTLHKLSGRKECKSCWLSALKDLIQGSIQRVFSGPATVGLGEKMKYGGKEKQKRKTEGLEKIKSSKWRSVIAETAGGETLSVTGGFFCPEQHEVREGSKLTKSPGKFQAVGTQTGGNEYITSWSVCFLLPHTHTKRLLGYITAGGLASWSQGHGTAS